MKRRVAPVFLAAMGIPFAVTPVVSAPGWQARVSPEVLKVYQQSTSNSASSSVSQVLSVSSARMDTHGRVQIDVHFDCGLSPPAAALKAAALSINATVKLPPTCAVEGWVSPSALPAIASVPGVTVVKVPVYASHRHHGRPAGGNASPQQPQSGIPGGLAIPQGMGGPTIDGAGIAILNAGKFITQTQTNGSGVTVGVMSDDVASLSVIQAQGELPNVTVLPSAPNPQPTDEGTMMLEEVHALAPGASLAFCGPQSEMDYLNCLTSFAAAGATILVDDLAFHGDDLMSASGPFQQSIQNFLAANPASLMFTVTDNYNRSYAEGGYS